jgi:ankyrin repeat protein
MSGRRSHKGQKSWPTSSERRALRRHFCLLPSIYKTAAVRSLNCGSALDARADDSKWKQIMKTRLITFSLLCLPILLAAAPTFATDLVDLARKGNVEGLEAALAEQQPMLDLNQKDRYGNTLLSTAASSSKKDTYLPMLKFLLEHGANPNEPMGSESTPLHTAVRDSNQEAITLLLDHKADPNIGRGQMQTPVHIAVERCDESSLKLLLAHGGDLNAVGRFGLTPIHSIVQHGSVERLDPLIALGANVNVQDQTGLTPLHHAVKLRKVDMLRSLLEHKADPNLANAEGETPAHMLDLEPAKIADHSAADIAMARLLVRFHADCTRQTRTKLTPLWRAHLRRRDDLVQAMLDAGVEADVFTLLNLNQVDAARKLVEQDAALVKAQYCDDRTPLHFAVLCADDAFIAFLLKRVRLSTRGIAISKPLCI